MTRRYPRRRRVAHLTPPRRTDSIRGLVWARRHGFDWIDGNVLLSAEGTPHMAHGAPYGLAAQGFLPAGDGRRVRDLGDAELAALRSPDGYRIPTLAEYLAAAKRQGRRVELEAKDDRRFTHVETWQAIAEVARAVWPYTWRRRVKVKRLTNLSGGLEAALDVLEAAHAAGFPTILLPRGSDRHRPINRPAVTYNHGGRV